MTRPEPVRFLRTEATMAFAEGRLLVLADSQLSVLAADGWMRLPGRPPAGAVRLTREEAEDWCDREGWDLHLLDTIPTRT